MKESENTMRKGLGQMLIEAELVTAEQMDSARRLQQAQKKKLGDILTEQRLVTPEQLATVQSIRLNVPFIDLKRHIIQPCALSLVPEEIARKYTLIPLDIVAGALVVVMADPEDIYAVDDLQSRCKLRVDVALGIPDEIRQTIDLCYRASSEIEKLVSRVTPTTVKREEARITSDSLVQTPLVETLELLITQAVKDRASDIHIEPQKGKLRIRYRVDGLLRDAFSLPLSVHAPLISRLKILAEMNIAEQRRPQDGQFSFKVVEKDVDIRVATTETAYGERATLRILYKSLDLFTLPELGFRPETLKRYREMLKSTYGMILIGGPTGSGKTTTMYASINELDRNEHNIMTIEDPIEYRFQDINQIQVNTKAGINFANGLRTILRHDPDVILVGEIRDADTAKMAVQAALTGHLVLSSIHANDSVGVLFRLMDLGVEPYLLASTLTGIIAQRIVRRICIHCHAPSQPTLEERVVYFTEMAEEHATFFRGTGCNFCANTGYLGRTGLYECLVMSEEIRRLLLSKASASELRTQAIREGLVTIRHDGMLKVKEGITTSHEVLRNMFSIG